MLPRLLHAACCREHGAFGPLGARAITVKIPPDLNTVLDANVVFGPKLFLVLGIHMLLSLLSGSPSSGATVKKYAYAEAYVVNALLFGGHMQCAPLLHP